MLKKILICVCIFIITGCGCEKQENIATNEEKKINEGILKEQQVGDLKIYDVEAHLEQESTIFTIYIQNTSDNKIDIENIKINFKDNEGNQILDEPVITPFYSSIEAGDIQLLSVVVRQELTNAVSVEYDIVN